MAYLTSMHLGDKLTAIKTLIESSKCWKILVFRTKMGEKVQQLQNKKKVINKIFSQEIKNFGAGGDAKLKIFFARPNGKFFNMIKCI